MKRALIVVALVALSAARAAAQDAAVEDVRSSMYDAANHPYVRIWSPDRIGIVDIQGVPGRVAWVNPQLSFPQLGSPGSPPLAALARLFGIRISHDGPSDGKAAFPTHVGRSVNPNPNAIVVLGPDGRPVPDLVIKGVGSTKNRIDGFNFPLRDAVLDADIATNLMREGVSVYRPLLIFVPDGAPDKAVYVRAPDSMLRHKDAGLLSDAELGATLKIVAKDAGLGVREWAQDHLPRRTGRNAGLLAALGVQHGSPHGTDNHGLAAETVDWDRFSIDRGASGSQKSAFWNPVSSTLERINRMLPAAQRIDVDKALANFEKGYAEGLAHQGRIVLHEKTLEGLPAMEIRKIFSGESDLPDGRDALIRELKARGLVKGGSIEGWSETAPALSRASLKRAALREAGGAAQYAAAYLLKEAFKAAETRDPGHMKAAAMQLKEPAFWGSLALFSGASRLTEAAITRVPAAGALSRAAVPLAVGMAAVQIASGRFSPKDVAISTASFLVAGTAINLVADGLIYPILFAAGPPGWAAAGVYTVTKLAVTLYAGEKLEAWIRSLVERGARRDGVTQKLTQISGE